MVAGTGGALFAKQINFCEREEDKTGVHIEKVFWTVGGNDEGFDCFHIVANQINTIYSE